MLQQSVSHRKLRALGAAAACASLLLCLGCEPPAPSRTIPHVRGSSDAGAEDAAGHDATGHDGAGVDSGPYVFTDHTVPSFTEVDALQAYLAQGPARSQAKFVITQFGDAAARAVAYMKGDFYHMHDEWYWFRLLNGHAVVGCDTEPVDGLTFYSVEEIVAWAREQEELPLDLRFVGDGRLYSPLFYQLALQEPRSFGLGSIVYMPPREEPEPRGELWLFELEFVDRVTHEQLVVFFQTLEATLPAEVATSLRWVVRSESQQALADQMAAEQLPYWDRVTSYAQLVTPGEAEVYNPGVAAGRLRFVRPGEPGIEDAQPTDILVLGEVPDYLPPAAALITAVPQTPLAHINILARNRGIPNVYLAGVLEDPELDQLARAYQPVMVFAEPSAQAGEPDRVVLRPLSAAEYSTYRQLAQVPALSVPPVDLSGAPLFVDIEGAQLEEMASLRPLVGGKSAGLIALCDAIDGGGLPVAAPLAPLAITVKPYVEHLAPLVPRIEAVLADQAFAQDTRVRFLALEGEADFDGRFPDAEAQARKAALLARPLGDALADLVREGGLKPVLRAAEIAPATLVAIEDQLRARYGHYAATQGLRFRSSSNVEDIEGFNGAGLYTSNTGFLDPAAQPDDNDHKKSVAWALKKTWASYWGAEAFEERRLAGVDHLSGAMGVLVHARFDDPLEAANGVFTVTLRQVDGDVSTVMEVNTQVEDMSVTNPEPGSGALPEVVRVSQTGLRGEVLIERLQPSTEVAPGAVVLFDDTLRAMFDRSRAVAMAWLQQENAERHAWRKSRTLVLDFEHRLMRRGWPALASGELLPARMVVKQARSLDPGLARIPESLRTQPVPHDVLARARRVEQRYCSCAAFTLLTLEIYTDPLLVPDLGYSELPFNAFVSLSFAQAVPVLDIAAGHRFAFAHTDYSFSHPRMTPATWDLRVEFTPAAATVAGFEVLNLTPEGTWVMLEGEDYTAGGGVRCSTTLLYSTPEDYLLSLLDAG